MPLRNGSELMPSTAKDIQAAQVSPIRMVLMYMDPSSAQALSTKAIQKEVNKNYDAAFELHVQAAEAFLHLAQTLGDTHAKTTCRAAAKKALERAEQIKKFKGDVVRPVVANPYSPRELSTLIRFI
jgi:hypothetical protein